MTKRNSPGAKLVSADVAPEEAGRFFLLSEVHRRRGRSGGSDCALGHYCEPGVFRVRQVSSLSSVRLLVSPSEFG